MMTSNACFISMRLRSPSVFTIRGSMMSLCTVRISSMPSSCKACNKAMHGCTCLRCLVFDDRRFPFRGRMIDYQIKAAAAKWISKTALLIRSHEDEWNGPRLDGTHLGDGERPCRKKFKQNCFKRVVDFIDFIDEQDTTFFLLYRSEQRACQEEGSAGQVAANLFPVARPLCFGLQEDKELLETLIELAYGLLFVDALIALQTEEFCSGRPRYRLRQLGFAGSSGALEQDWLVDCAGEIDCRSRFAIGKVANASQAR